VVELRNAGRIDEAIIEHERLLTQATNDDERASILRGLEACYRILGRLVEARRVLGQIQQLDISDLEIRLSSEFDEPCLLVEEGKTEEGICAFASILQRHGEALKEDCFRYLYEDIQRRRAFALIAVSRFTEALPILKDAASFRFDEATYEQQIHFGLALCFEETNDFEAAKREFLRVVAFNLKNDLEEQARYRLSRLYVRAHGFAQARKQLETIIQEFSAENNVVPRKYIYEQLSKVCACLGDKANETLYMALAKTAPDENRPRE
jgi:tetratricopeptide (TPR) repeat protein